MFFQLNKISLRNNTWRYIRKQQTENNHTSMQEGLDGVYWLENNGHF